MTRYARAAPQWVRNSVIVGWPSRESDMHRRCPHVKLIGEQHLSLQAPNLDKRQMPVKTVAGHNDVQPNESNECLSRISYTVITKEGSTIHFKVSLFYRC